ncbi:MBL fold metallo-hydrolase [Coprobacillus cateniformis]|nr:MBL fold metallo-hydrolase [Coprobacillus cateniformis]RGY46747.1 MBL fold metallo-hydrolase [Coprobacillus cateniformis]
MILTHGHFDHCQNTSYLVKKLNCFVGIGREDVLLLEKNEKRKLFGKGLWGSFYARASNCNIWKNNVESVSPNIILDAGMSLLEYGVDGNVIRLQGHTKGSIGIALTSGELFVGDAMQNIIFPTTTWCFEDYQQAQESAKLIKSINAKKIYYGHG